MKRIIITCNHLSLSESVVEFVESKFATLLDHYGEIIRIRVELNLDSGNASEMRFVARAIVEIGGADIISLSKSDNAYAALDGVLRKSRRQLRRRSREKLFKRDRGFVRGAESCMELSLDRFGAWMRATR